MGVVGRLILTWFGLAVCAGLGAGVGLLVGNVPGMPQHRQPNEKVYPFPHHVPKQADGVSLRFAMVHDVIHERFPRHGPAYYKDRNRRVRQALEGMKGREASPEDFALMDDLAIGLEFAGEHDEALRVMRDKWRRHQAQVFGGAWYTTYANLGTLLILGPFREVRPGNEDDKQTLREGLGLIHKAIEVNPGSHFGREIWQAVLIEYMIALPDDPRLLVTYDMVGHSLVKDVDPSNRRPVNTFLGHPDFNGPRARALIEGSGKEETRKEVRDLIAETGAEEGWVEAVVSSHKKPVAFDEPTLGIIGMWRLGGGAHPYFALALGETMLRVGQRYIAWSAYERAARLADKVWPDPGLQQQFAEHCRKRQKLIEDQLSSSEVPRLRPAFEAELARGLEYQQAYQRYEEEQIAAGRSPDDPHFYDGFRDAHGSIATKVGPEDQWVVIRGLQPTINYPAIFLCSGFAVMLGVGIIGLRESDRIVKSNQEFSRRPNHSPDGN